MVCVLRVFVYCQWSCLSSLFFFVFNVERLHLYLSLPLSSSSSSCTFFMISLLYKNIAGFFHASVSVCTAQMRPAKAKTETALSAVWYLPPGLICLQTRSVWLPYRWAFFTGVAVLFSLCAKPITCLHVVWALWRGKVSALFLQMSATQACGKVISFSMCLLPCLHCTDEAHMGRIRGSPVCSMPNTFMHLPWLKTWWRMCNYDVNFQQERQSAWLSLTSGLSTIWNSFLKPFFFFLEKQFK